MNVSSIAVRTLPQHLEKVINDINSIDLCEVHFYDHDGKIVVTIEGESINEQMERLKLIQKLPSVYSANVMYAYCEEEISDALEGIRADAGTIPDKLKDN